MEVTQDVSNPDKLKAAKVSVSNTVATNVTSGQITPRRGIQLKADAGNGGTIYIGGSDVSNTLGFPLNASEGIFLPIADTSNLFALASTTGQILWYIII